MDVALVRHSRSRPDTSLARRSGRDAFVGPVILAVAATVAVGIGALGWPRQRPPVETRAEAARRAETDTAFGVLPPRSGSRDPQSYIRPLIGVRADHEDIHRPQIGRPDGTAELAAAAGLAAEEISPAAAITPAPEARSPEAQSLEVRPMAARPAFDPAVPPLLPAAPDIGAITGAAQEGEEDGRESAPRLPVAAAAPTGSPAAVTAVSISPGNEPSIALPKLDLRAKAAPLRDIVLAVGVLAGPGGNTDLVDGGGMPRSDPRKSVPTAPKPAPKSIATASAPAKLGAPASSTTSSAAALIPPVGVPEPLPSSRSPLPMDTALAPIVAISEPPEEPLGSLVASGDTAAEPDIAPDHRAPLDLGKAAASAHPAAPASSKTGTAEPAGLLPTASAATLMPSRITENTIAAPIAVGQILFEADGTDLPSGSEASLDKIIRTAQAEPRCRVEVMAYAGGGTRSGATGGGATGGGAIGGGATVSPDRQDGTNDRAPNDVEARRMALSRALAIRAYLVRGGIADDRVDVRALGNRQGGGPEDRVDLIVGEQ